VTKRLREGEVTIYLGDASRASTVAVGVVYLDFGLDRFLVLKDCLYVPSFRKNLISVSKLFMNNFSATFDNKVVIRFGKKFIYSGSLADNLYILESKSSPLQQKQLLNSSSNLNKRKEPSKMNETYLWHLRLGHINLRRIQRLVADAPLGSLEVEGFPTCESCLEGKMTKRVFSSKGHRAEDVLGLDHSDLCGFSYKLCARAKRDVWRITTLKLEHICEGSLTHNRHRSANSKVLAHIYAPTIQTNPQTVSTRRIIEQMREEHGLSISYNVSLRARHRAFEKFYGGHEESWGRLPSYLHMLQVHNPGTIVELQRDGEVFQHLFFALGASIEGFQRAGVPVIVIDGTHLKGKYKGIIFVAATLDGNNQIFSLTVGIGDVKRRETWSWFLTQLKRAHGCPDNLLIISDRHESIIYYVPIVFLEAHHSFCCYHITKQMRSFGKSVLDIFYKAACCYRRENFYRYLSSLQSLKPEAFKKLTNEIPVNAWARCSTPVQRYGFMTSNSCESLNNKLRWAWMLPVCSLLECVRATIEKWFAVRCASAEGRNHPLTQWTQLWLDFLFEKGRTLSITTLGMQRYRVMEETRSYVVDLEARTCDCRVFEIDLLPCLHASTAIR
ncbi:Unknown protein, partial [Striga hermonthica]